MNRGQNRAAHDYRGVLRELVAGAWMDDASGECLRIPIRAIEIRDTLDGGEGGLARALHGNGKIVVVCDQITESILGARVALSIGGDCETLVLREPESTVETAEDLRRQTRHADALVAVGSGTVSDLVKYASFLGGKSYSVFPTSPMNAYTTGTASLTDAGIKRSLPAHNARGVFVDLQILAGCPQRLINSALSDVVCRTTAQVDWLLSRDFRGTPYSDIPYRLLAYDEESLFANARRLRERDLDVMASLVRTCALNGLGSAVVGTTHPGSMAEHMVSHYLDMFAGDAHPGTLHGEQVGVATLSICRLQNRILRAEAPPVIHFAPRGKNFFTRQFGVEQSDEYAACYAAKAFSARDAEKWNAHLAERWDDFTAPMRAVMLSAEEVAAPLIAAGAPMSPEDLGFDAAFYAEAVRNARFIRDRFTILDLADHCGLLESESTAL